MSSDDEIRFKSSLETREYDLDDEEVSNVVVTYKMDDLSMEFDVKDSHNLEHLVDVASDEKGDNLVELMDEERRSERHQERRQRLEQTEEQDAPSETNYQTTETTVNSVAQPGTVMATTEKSGPGKDHSESDEENRKPMVDNDLEAVECGRAAARRKALEEYAEEAKRSHTSSRRLLEEDAPVLKVGKAANTRAKLERMSSEEKIIEKGVDVNAPKTGTASERRARFEEKAKKASVEVPRQKARTARRSKWPEPNTNYRQRQARELRKSVSTDEENSINVELENAKNIEKSKEDADGRTETSMSEGPKSPVRTAEIRNKLVRMSSSDGERTSSSPADFGSTRPSVGTARNLRAKFETNKQTEELGCNFHSNKTTSSIPSRSGYALKVREKFESGEVARRGTSLTDDDENSGDTDPATRRTRTSSTRSVEQEAGVMSRTAKELRSRFENPIQNSQQQVVKRNFVVRPKAANSNVTSRFQTTAPKSSKCTVCGKTVYPMEMITADDKVFHKKCFKCTECKATLRLGNYAALQGQIYCKPHFKQLFKVKGNYDEGFGRQQHKKNWEVKNQSNSEDNKMDISDEVDSNANIKAPENDTPHENGFRDPPAEQSNGYDLPDEDAFISNHAIVT